jgi:hypothetical protein
MPLPEIEFEGKRVIPEDGYYKCPFRCGDKRFPQPKWKTEGGFRKHMLICINRPSAIAQQKAREQKRQEEENRISMDRLAECPFKVGDTVFAVIEIITGPTHDSRGRRIRYEPEKYFDAREETIKSIEWAGNIGDYGGSYFYNGLFWHNAICASMAEAKSKAEQKTKGWNEHVRFSEDCR